jgi:secreted trypsin-like serine protease
MEILVLCVLALLLPLSWARFEPYVEGGERVTIEEIPFMAAILLVEGDGIHSLKCTGTIIDARYVLTAAHCLE